MKLFVIDWSKDATTPLLDLCKQHPPHKVIGFELLDGAEAYRKTGILKPDAIVVNYAAKPSHGKQTADSIHKRKLTATIPIYFINGNEEDNELVSNIGICLSDEELKELLES